MLYPFYNAKIGEDHELYVSFSYIAKIARKFVSVNVRQIINFIGL